MKTNHLLLIVLAAVLIFSIILLCFVIEYKSQTGECYENPRKFLEKKYNLTCECSNKEIDFSKKNLSEIIFDFPK